MPINTQITGSETYGKHMRVLLAGDPGSGKTLMSSTFPNPYYISAEGNTMSIARKFLPFVKLDKTDDLKEIYSALRQEPLQRARLLGVPGPVDTVVIDTIDEVSKLFQKERLKAKSIEAFENYKDWGWLQDKVEGVVRSFRNLPLNVIFTVHLKADKDDDSGAISYLPNLYGQTARYLPGAVDLAFVLQSRSSIGVENNQSVRKVFRYAQTYGDSKFSWAKDHSGRVTHEFPVNFEDDYARLYQAIYGGIEDDFAAAKKRALESAQGHAESIKAKFEDRPDPLAGAAGATGEAEMDAFIQSQTQTPARAGK